MPFSQPKSAFFGFCVCLALGSVYSTGCSDTQPETAQTAAGSTATYVVRGEITGLPDADNPTSSLMIRHEAIPDFVDAQGKTVGMDTMTMPFPPAAELDLSPFSVGDQVAVTFVVTWGAGHNGWEATQLTTLPADTPLDFTPLAKPDDGHAGHDHAGHDHHSGHQH